LVSGTQAEAGAHEDQAGTTSNWRLTAYGVCGQPMPGHQVVWRGSDWGSLETRNASVSCPEGLVVIGAGARIRGADGRVKVDEIRPGYLLRSVEVHASEDEVGTSSNWDVLAYAICAVRPSGHQLVEASVDRGWLAATPAVAACPQGKKLLSAFGGVKAFDTKNLRVSRMMPTGNLRAATVIASTTGGSTRGDVNAYAICMDE
jgi:hypothetical protein